MFEIVVFAVTSQQVVVFSSYVRKLINIMAGSSGEAISGIIKTIITIKHLQKTFCVTVHFFTSENVLCNSTFLFSSCFPCSSGPICYQSWSRNANILSSKIFIYIQSFYQHFESKQRERWINEEGKWSYLCIYCNIFQTLIFVSEKVYQYLSSLETRRLYIEKLCLLNWAAIWKFNLFLLSPTRLWKVLT